MEILVTESRLIVAKWQCDNIKPEELDELIEDLEVTGLDEAIESKHYFDGEFARLDENYQVAITPEENLGESTKTIRVWDGDSREWKKIWDNAPKGVNGCTLQYIWAYPEDADAGFDALMADEDDVFDLIVGERDFPSEAEARHFLDGLLEASNEIGLGERVLLAKIV